MAEIKVKEYSKEAMKRLGELLTETKGVRESLDELDDKLMKTDSPSVEVLKEWSRKATGWGNYLRKKLKKLESAMKNEKGIRYLEIKMEYANANKSFIDASTKMEALVYVAPLRKVRDIFIGYVFSADQVVSTCRLNLKEVDNNIEV